MKMSPCRGCGKAVVWGVKPDGSKVPLDPRAPVYAIVAFEDLPVQAGKFQDPIIHIKRTPTIKDNEPPFIASKDEKDDHLSVAYVSHFATCSKASDFSGSGKASARSI